jgi:hypothetical protein
LHATGLVPDFIFHRTCPRSYFLLVDQDQKTPFSLLKIYIGTIYSIKYTLP